MNFDAFFSRHQRIAFQFSAGKDSAAVLWLLRRYWDKLDVIWCNPGKPYPETLEYMGKISKLVPRFFVVNGQQPAYIADKGWPVDILPIECSAVGQQLSKPQPFTLQLASDCCWANMWRPMQEFINRWDYSAVIRGQKQSDTLKGPLTSGVVVEGIEYFYPIEDWSDEDVFRFLGEDRLPPSYKRGLRSSLDCINCPAYTSENPGRIQDLQAIDPVAWRQVTTVHLHLVERLREHSEYIRSCHADATSL